MPLDVEPLPGVVPAAALPPVPEATETAEPVTPDTSKMTDANPEFDPAANPVVKLISSGEMSGIIGAPDQYKGQPELASLIANPKSMLTKTGLGFFGTKDGRFAIFNPTVIKPAEIKDLDAKGKLDVMLTPIDKLFGGPVGTGGGKPGGMYDSMLGGQPPGMTAPAPAGPMSPPANPRTLQTRMRANIAAGLPAPRTPSPTGGSIYNKVIGKPV